MTNSLKSLIGIAIITQSPLLVHGQEAPDPNVHGDPYVPVGTLGVNPTFVQIGVRPNLDWGIEYPMVFNDLALVGGSGSLVTTNQEVQTEIRVNGSSNDCTTENGTDLDSALWVRVGGAGNYWRLLFYGNKRDVNPSKVLYKSWLPVGTPIELAARAKSPSGGWYPIVWTIEDTVQLAHLGNGDTVPDYIIPKFSTSELKSYTTALLSEDNLTAEIGPKDMVYLFELTATDPADPCFDLEDLVVTIHFKTKNNNGHGNNVDGVDVSNPGQGGGGPNGIEDPSGEIDDEMKKGNGKLK